MRRLFFLLSFIWLNVYANDMTSVAPPKKLEWGAGFLSFYGHHYRGSDQRKLWFFPMPYFTYNSEKVEAEPSFIRGIFVRNEWFSFKLSLMLGPNAESERNRARIGMPSLDYTLEAGPLFLFHLWASQQKDVILDFEWPMRAVFATDLSYLKYVGLFTVPYLSLKHTPSPKNWNWSSEITISPMYADAKYHQHFYGVEQTFVREERPFYQARGGYSGFQTALVFNKRIKNMVIIPFIRWDYLKGAVFEGSPLVKTKNYLIGGLGLFWFFN